MNSTRTIQLNSHEFTEISPGKNDPKVALGFVGQRGRFRVRVLA